MIHTHTLTNGLRIIHRDLPTKIARCGIAVNCGSRDEYAEEAGMAHFVEHMLFKGTRKRKAHHIAARMESVGGDLNAYTTKEETFYYATFLSEYFSRAVELLADMLLHSTFEPQLIDRERGVIIDEIHSYEDLPVEQIYDDFENLLFDNHELGHYILGDPNTLNQFTKERIIGFMSRQYQPSQMVFFSTGKIPFSKVVKWVEKYFSFSYMAEKVKPRQAPSFQFRPVKEQMHKKTTQSHVMMGVPVFSMHHPQRYALLLLNNLLGGESLNSRLNATLREKYGLVYQVESSVTLYSDVGLFTVYFAVDEKQRERCTRLVNREIGRFLDKKLTARQLALEKRRWKGQLGIAAEQIENNTLSMAKRFLHSNSVQSSEEVFAQVEAITADEIYGIANEYFGQEPFVLSYL